MVYSNLSAGRLSRNRKMRVEVELTINLTNGFGLGEGGDFHHKC